MCTFCYYSLFIADILILCVLLFQVIAVIQKLEPMIEYMHFSDQYSGPRQPE